MAQLILSPTDIVKKKTTFVFNSTLLNSQEDKTVLAPMQNLTSLFFRKTFAKYFPQTVDYAVTPFISACSNTANSKSIAFDDIKKEENENSLPIVPQIIGRNTEHIVQTCKIIECMGYREVNLNMGCPKKDIVSRGRGSGLLDKPEDVRAIIEAILKNTSLLLSIKVRTGIKNDTDLEKMIPMLNSYPLKSVTIHPRRAIDFYEGRADEDKFEYLAKELKHTIIYNGDIFSKEDFVRLKSRFPFVNQWMIGRGLIRNPFLAAEIKGFPITREILKPFVLELKESFESSLRKRNETLVLNKMKEFSKYICQGLNISEAPFVHSTSLNEITKLFENYL